MALATSGILMTGCTDINLSQNQVDKILTVVDNTDKFMNETMDLLQESNAKIDRETAAKLYKYSLNRLKLNKDNVWDNMEINFLYSSGDDDGVCIVRYFTLQNGVSVLYYIENDEVVGYHDSTQEPQVIREDLGGGLTSIEFIKSYEYYASTSIMGTQDGVTFDIDYDNIVDCRILDNGNYFITASIDNFMDEEGKNVIIDCEITSDGYLKNFMYYGMLKMFIPDSSVSGNYELERVKVEYNYNELTEAEVLGDIDEYNASQDA